MMMLPIQHYIVNECKKNGRVVLPDLKNMTIGEYQGYMEFSNKGYLTGTGSLHEFILTDKFYQDEKK